MKRWEKNLNWRLESENYAKNKMQYNIKLCIFEHCVKCEKSEENNLICIRLGFNEKAKLTYLL